MVRRSQTTLTVHPEAGDAVVAAVRHEQQPAVRRKLDLRAGVALCHARGQGGHRLQRRERSVSPNGVRRHTAPLLVGEIHDVQGWVICEVPRPDHVILCQRGRVIGSQCAAGPVEAVLINDVGRRNILGRFQHVVVLPGNVRNVGETVGPVGLDRVCARVGVEHARSRTAHAAVVAQWVHGSLAVRVVGRQ